MGVKVRQKIKGKGKPWWVFISHNGQRRSKMIGDKQSAEATARVIRQKLAKGEFSLESKSIPSFGEYAVEWLKYVDTMRRKSTYNRYSQILDKQILPVFKKKDLDKITRAIVS